MKVALCTSSKDFDHLTMSRLSNTSSCVIDKHNYVPVSDETGGMDGLQKVRMYTGPEALMLLDRLSYNLISRGVCETDTRFLQPIPYIALVRKPKLSTDYQVLIYSRGKGGEEQRLHSKLSIGVGGHIEDIPVPGRVEFTTVASNAAIRELSEEIGFTNQDYFHRDFYGNMFLLRDTRTITESVHLGLMTYVSVTSEEEYTVFEEGCIEEPQWVSLVKLLSSEELYDRLEPWSKVLLSWIQNKVNTPS